MNLEQLKIEHDMIDRLAGDLAGLADGGPASHTSAAASLARLAEPVASHLEKENVLVYATIARVRGRSAGEAFAIVTTFNALKADWEAYVAEWTAGRIAFGWAEFHRDSASMLTRLRARVREETFWLYPLALKHGVFRMRVQ